jgi:tRNA threonylcarbamoyl adenosine modification protein (Sua5/YciO/YrdC/YwlC family)
MTKLIDRSLRELHNGGVVIIPSESCYGISCLASNLNAINKIHQIKKEPQNKPLTILVSNLSQLEQIGILNKTAIKLSQKFHPGSLSIIIELKNDKYCYLSQNGIAFRIPGDEFTRSIIAQLGQPIVTTSANIHGDAPIYKQNELDAFKNIVDYIYKSGDLNSNILPSTIYDSRSNKILRQGPITHEQINKSLCF